MTKEVKVEQEKRAEVSIMKGDRKYQLLLPMDTSIGEAYEAAYSILLRIVEIAKEHAEKMQPVAPTEPTEAIEPEVVEVVEETKE